MEVRKRGYYLQAAGKLEYGLTNDYMFCATLQTNNRVLKGLVCSVMHLRPEEVESVKIENPIVLGEAFGDKTFVLDIRVCLDNRGTINFEMQVLNELNWPERSLAYLCRVFDRLNQGEDYIRIRPVTHIGFLDFTLFPEVPEFYATYRMMNEKNHHIYTGKFTLGVINLKQIRIATEEDRKWKIDYWASLFKATTWEEIRMLAEKNELIGEAADTLYQLSEDERIREQCFQREEYYRNERTNLRLRQMAEERAEQAEERIEIERQRAEKEKQKAEKEKQKAKKEKQRADSMFAMLVRVYREQGKTKQETVEAIAGQTGQSLPETEEALNRIWE